MNKTNKKIKNHIKPKQNQMLSGGFGQALGDTDFEGLSQGILQAATANGNTGDKISGITDTVGTAIQVIPGFGTVIGGVIKGVGKIVGGIFGRQQMIEARRKAEAKARAIKQQEALAQNTQINNSAGNKIYPDSLGSNIYAKGGLLETVNPNENLIKIESGGTHEENPIGGVPMGTDAEGTMNTVEQGETVLKDFVYSNRIKLPEDIDLKSEYNLPNALKGKTFAKASEIINNKFKEREDKVSLETKQVFLDRLAALQEELKQAKQDAEMTANGVDPNIENQAVLDTQNEQAIDSIGEQQNVQESEDIVPQNQFKIGGSKLYPKNMQLLYDPMISNKYSSATAGYNNQREENKGKSEYIRRPKATTITNVEKLGPSGLPEDILTIKTPDSITERNYNRYTRPSYMDENGNVDWSKVSTREAKQLIRLSPYLKDSYEEYSLDKKSRMLDNKAAINAIIGNLSKLNMNKAPDRADYSTSLLPQFGTLYPRLTNKARLFNAIDRSARSAEYSLRNLFGSNPGALMANLGSLKARQLNAKADTALQVEDRDNQIKMATDQHNNQMAQRNALYNQQIIKDNQDRYMNARRDFEDTRASIIGGLFSNLDQIIQDKRNKNFLRRMAPIYGKYSMLAGMAPSQVRKYGGKIKRK